MVLLHAGADSGVMDLHDRFPHRGLAMTDPHLARLLGTTALPGLPLVPELREPFTMDIHVLPNEHEEWSVENRTPGVDTLIDSTWPTQKEAEARARAYLKDIGGGSLTLYGQDGKAKDPVSVKAPRD